MIFLLSDLKPAWQLILNENIISNSVLKIILGMNNKFLSKDIIEINYKKLLFKY